MRFTVLLLALAMLVTGSINTVSVKYQDMVVVGHSADGSPLHFKHPVVQAAFMFFGESLCLIPYFLLRWHKWSRRKAGLEPPSKRPKQPRGFFIKRALMFSLPALCDSMASVLLNLGLFYTNASTYQMLRGTLVLFAGTFTVLLLRRRLFLHHWIGMILITAGAMIVGAASVVYSSSKSPPPTPPFPAPLLMDGTYAEAPGLDGSGAEAGLLAAVWESASGHFANLGWQLSKALRRIQDEAATDALLGDILVVVAQAFAALQFIVEEKLLGTFKMQPLVAVGLEGMWGMVLCLFALPLVPLVHDSRGRPLDDLPMALREMAANPRLLGAVLLGITSIGFFNFFGLSVTKALSGASRATIDACRTLFVWIVAMSVGWEVFHDLQVVGFLVLVAGTSLYNEILRSCLPHVYPAPAQQGREDDDGNSSCSSASYTGNDNDLEAPLLLLESNGTSRVHIAGTAHQPMRIPQHHAEAQHYMARSLTLGITALSPQPLDYEDTKPYSVTQLVGDILNVSPTGSSLTPDASLMRSRTSCDMDGGSARGSGTALSQYEQRQEAAAAAGRAGGAGQAALPARPPPPAPAPTPALPPAAAVGLGSGSNKSPNKALGGPAPTALPAAAEVKQAALPVASVGVEEERSTDCPPEEAAHLTHVYKPGGQLQHALEAAGQVQKPAAGPEGPSTGQVQKPAAGTEGPSAGQVQKPAAGTDGPSSGQVRKLAEGPEGPSAGQAASAAAGASPKSAAMRGDAVGAPTVVPKAGSSAGPVAQAVAGTAGVGSGPAAAPRAAGPMAQAAAGSAGEGTSGATAAPAAAAAAAAGGDGAAAKKGGKGGAKKKGSKKK